MKKIVIDNFRSFKNQEFTFAKVNILIGENSGGKSSVLKFILALKQTLIRRDSSSNLVLFGAYVDLGNYKEIIYNNNTDQKLSFQFEFGTEYVDFFFNFFFQPLKEKPTEETMKLFNDSLKGFLGKAIESSSTVKYVLDENLDKHTSIGIEFFNSHIGLLTIEHQEQTKLETIDLISGSQNLCTLKLTDPVGKETVLKDIEYVADGFISRIESNSLRRALRAIGDEDSSMFYNIAFLLVLQNFLVENLGKVRFINPFHANPERVYTMRDKSNYINMNIENMINILGDKNLPPVQKEKLISSIGEALQSFGLAEEIQLLSDENIAVHELRTKIKDLWSNITDVGYGVSLQLPIIFQTIISEARGGEIILIEQPEVHLHPKLQANFIETILKIGPRNTYFIETHSEHIVRKLQSISKAGTTNRNDISIHYFSRTTDKSVVTQHCIESNWRLNPNLPGGFFDSSYLLAKELL